MKCLNPHCKSKAHSRGLCRSCITMANRLVKAGQTTWAILEKRGKVQPSKRKIITEWLLGK